MKSIDNRARSAADEAINQLASDRTSGAAEILRQAGAVFTELNTSLSQHKDVTFEQALEIILETCIALASAQPAMTPLLRLASAALIAARTATKAREASVRAEQTALDFITKAARSAHDAALVSATLFRDGSTALTHSRSSTVLTAFIEAKRAGRNISVVATESRPLLEGRAVAEALAGKDIPVTLIADAAAGRAMEEVDLILLGADEITPSIHVNKIGTRMIALAARERGLPVYAICDSSKFICEDYFRGAIRQSRNADELWVSPPRGVSIANCYFETTPLSCFTGIIIEDGMLAAAEAARRAERSTIDAALVRGLEEKANDIKERPG